MQCKFRLGEQSLAAALLALVITACGVGSADRHPERVRIAPANVDAVPLTSPSGYPAEHRAAAGAVIASIRKGGEDPGAFFAQVDAEGGLLIFHLWHESAFLPENQGVPGNPGGLCRDVHVDPASMEVVATLWWQ
jgi:hypothetical protein